MVRIEEERRSSERRIDGQGAVEVPLRPVETAQRGERESPVVEARGALGSRPNAHAEGGDCFLIPAKFVRADSKVEVWPACSGIKLHRCCQFLSGAVKFSGQQVGPAERGVFPGGMGRRTLARGRKTWRSIQSQCSAVAATLVFQHRVGAEECNCVL